jgi:hypothetical protein
MDEGTSKATWFIANELKGSIADSPITEIYGCRWMNNEQRGTCDSAYEYTTLKSLFWSTSTAKYISDKTWVGRDGGQ